MSAKKPHPLQWLAEPLEEEPSFVQRAMFGCQACYLDGRLVLVLAMRPKGPWRGVLVPTDRERRPAILAEFPALKPHPVLPKWLYLPEAMDEFEEIGMEIVERILAGDERFGVEPGEKSAGGRKSKERKEKPSPTRVGAKKKAATKKIAKKAAAKKRAATKSKKKHAR